MNTDPESITPDTQNSPPGDNPEDQRTLRACRTQARHRGDLDTAKQSDTARMVMSDDPRIWRPLNF